MMCFILQSSSLKQQTLSQEKEATIILYSFSAPPKKNVLMYALK